MQHVDRREPSAAPQKEKRPFVAAAASLGRLMSELRDFPDLQPTSGNWRFRPKAAVGAAKSLRCNDPRGGIDPRDCGKDEHPQIRTSLSKASEDSRSDDESSILTGNGAQTGRPLSRARSDQA